MSAANQETLQIKDTSIATAVDESVQREQAASDAKSLQNEQLNLDRDVAVDQSHFLTYVQSKSLDTEQAHNDFKDASVVEQMNISSSAFDNVGVKAVNDFDESKDGFEVEHTDAIGTVNLESSKNDPRIDDVNCFLQIDKVEVQVDPKCSVQNDVVQVSSDSKQKILEIDKVCDDSLQSEGLNADNIDKVELITIHSIQVEQNNPETSMQVEQLNIASINDESLTVTIQDYPKELSHFEESVAENIDLNKPISTVNDLNIQVVDISGTDVNIEQPNTVENMHNSLQSDLIETDSMGTTDEVLPQVAEGTFSVCSLADNNATSLHVDTTSDLSMYHTDHCTDSTLLVDKSFATNDKTESIKMETEININSEVFLQKIVQNLYERDLSMYESTFLGNDAKKTRKVDQNNTHNDSKSLKIDQPNVIIDKKPVMVPEKTEIDADNSIVKNVLVTCDDTKLSQHEKNYCSNENSDKVALLSNLINTSNNEELSPSVSSNNDIALKPLIKDQTNIIENKESIKYQTKTIENKESIKDQTNIKENRELITDRTNIIEQKESLNSNIDKDSDEIINRFQSMEWLKPQAAPHSSMGRSRKLTLKSLPKKDERAEDYFEGTKHTKNMNNRRHSNDSMQNKMPIPATQDQTNATASATIWNNNAAEQLFPNVVNNVEEEEIYEAIAVSICTAQQEEERRKITEVHLKIKVHDDPDEVEWGKKVHFNLPDSLVASSTSCAKGFVDKFGRVDGKIEKHLFMGKGARRKEQEFLQAHTENAPLPTKRPDQDLYSHANQDSKREAQMPSRTQQGPTNATSDREPQMPSKTLQGPSNARSGRETLKEKPGFNHDMNRDYHPQQRGAPVKQDAKTDVHLPNRSQQGSMNARSRQEMPKEKPKTDGRAQQDAHLPNRGQQGQENVRSKQEVPKEKPKMDGRAQQGPSNARSTAQEVPQTDGRAQQGPTNARSEKEVPKEKPGFRQGTSKDPPQNQKAGTMQQDVNTEARLPNRSQQGPMNARSEKDASKEKPGFCQGMANDPYFNQRNHGHVEINQGYLDKGRDNIQKNPSNYGRYHENENKNQDQLNKQQSNLDRYNNTNRHHDQFNRNQNHTDRDQNQDNFNRNQNHPDRSQNQDNFTMNQVNLDTSQNQEHLNNRNQNHPNRSQFQEEFNRHQNHPEFNRNQNNMNKYQTNSNRHRTLSDRSDENKTENQDCFNQNKNYCDRRNEAKNRNPDPYNRDQDSYNRNQNYSDRNQENTNKSQNRFGRTQSEENWDETDNKKYNLSSQICLDNKNQQKNFSLHDTRKVIADKKIEPLMQTGINKENLNVSANMSRSNVASKPPLNSSISSVGDLKHPVHHSTPNTSMMSLALKEVKNETKKEVVKSEIGITFGNIHESSTSVSRPNVVLAFKGNQNVQRALGLYLALNSQGTGLDLNTCNTSGVQSVNEQLMTMSPVYSSPTMNVNAVPFEVPNFSANQAVNSQNLAGVASNVALSNVTQMPNLPYGYLVGSNANNADQQQRMNEISNSNEELLRLHNKVSSLTNQLAEAQANLLEAQVKFVNEHASLSSTVTSQLSQQILQNQLPQPIVPSQLAQQMVPNQLAQQSLQSQLPQQMVQNLLPQQIMQGQQMVPSSTGSQMIQSESQSSPTDYQAVKYLVPPGFSAPAANIQKVVHADAYQLAKNFAVASAQELASNEFPSNPALEQMLMSPQYLQQCNMYQQQAAVFQQYSANGGSTSGIPRERMIPQASKGRELRGSGSQFYNQ